MATGKALNGKPYAGNPHVRFDEGEVASAATPRRGSLLYTRNKVVAGLSAIFWACSMACSAQSPFPDVRFAGRPLTAELAYDSAYPLNQVWPGYERPLHQRKVDAFVQFDVTESGRLELPLPEGVHAASVRVRPMSRAPGRVDGRRIVFDITAPEQFVVEFGEGRPQLHVFANPPFRYRHVPGEIYFGPGEHEAGLICPTNGQTVCLDAGATVYGAILMENVTNVTVTGRGILDSSRIRRVSSDGRYLRTLSAEDRSALRDVTALMCRGCAHVRVDGIVFRDSPFWILIFRNGCQDVRIDNVKTVGQWRYNSDGIDICGCQDVTMRNSFIRSFDDSFVVRDGGAGREGGTCHVLRNVTCENCILWCDWGYNFKAQLTGVRGARIEDVTVRKCVFANVSSGGIIVAARPGGPEGVVRGVTVEDIEYDVPAPRYRNQYQKKENPAEAFMPKPMPALSLFAVYNYDLSRVDVSKINLLFDRLAFRRFRVFGEAVPYTGTFRLTAGHEEVRDLVIEDLPPDVSITRKATFVNARWASQ